MESIPGARLLFSLRFGSGWWGMARDEWGAQDIEELLGLGKMLDEQPDALIHVAENMLRVLGRDGVIRPLRANAVQRAFERDRGQRNIVLKARQMGVTTWVAARFFLKTITARGVLTVQVAHTREAAEGIFRMVQRFWECLPEELRENGLVRSKANVGQMIFPALDSEFRIVSAGDEGAGRGLTIQNLHCSEVSRWPGDAGETLAGLRGARWCWSRRRMELMGAFIRSGWRRV